MAGYLPSSFFPVCGPRRSRVPEIRRKGTRPKSRTLDRTSLLKKGTLLAQSVIPNGQDSAMLRARVANPGAGFGSYCPYKELVTY